MSEPIMTIRTGFIDGELVVQNGPTEDVPPDVYEFEFEEGRVQLCLYCIARRTLENRLWMGEMGPLIKGGVCEDCGNDS